MSAMTRNHAGPGHQATPQMRDYYARRAAGGVGLILTEGIIVHPSGNGQRNVPHMFEPAQAHSWQPVTRAVHVAGGRILCQLWHCGRISHEDFTGGVQPVSSTSRRATGINRHNGKPYGVPHALRPCEFPAIYEQFRHAALLALDAGFDGVELHFGHGYLADQFLDGRVNDREDRYGGSVENRCRFALELIDHMAGDVEPRRIAVRLSPSRYMNGIYDWPDMPAMLDHLVPALHRAGIRILDISCASSTYADTAARVVDHVRPLWPHVLVAGASLDPAAAECALQEGRLDLVTYGRLLIANPDLVERFRSGLEPAPYDRAMLATLE